MTVHSALYVSQCPFYHEQASVYCVATAARILSTCEVYVDGMLFISMLHCLA